MEQRQICLCHRLTNNRLFVIQNRQPRLFIPIKSCITAVQPRIAMTPAAVKVVFMHGSCPLWYLRKKFEIRATARVFTVGHSPLRVHTTSAQLHKYSCSTSGLLQAYYKCTSPPLPSPPLSLSLQQLVQ